MSEPLVTVLMPVYNAMPYLPQAMDSILRQTERRLRVIAVNDGSTDESGSYLASISDPRVSILTQDNSGLVAALNLGLGQVRTPFMARMDADDICDITRLERQILFLQKNSDCVLVGCSANHIGMNSTRGGWPVFMPLHHDEIISAMLQRKSAVIHATICVRSEIFSRVGKYSATAWPAEDYEMFLRMGLHGKLSNLSETLYSIRLHSSSITSRVIMIGQKKYEDVCVQYRPAYASLFPNGVKAPERSLALFGMGIEADVRSVYFYRRALTRLVNGSRRSGFCFLFLSAMFSPLRAWEYVLRRLKTWYSVDL